MRIAITSLGPDLDSEVDYRFGRAAYFIFYDTDNDTFEALPNPAAMAPGGAGVQAAQIVASRGVTHVLTGEVGPNALPALMAAGIQIVRGISGRVKDIIEAFKRGELRPETGFEFAPPPYPGPPPAAATGDVKSLREHLERLKGQIEEMIKRLETLEKRGETK